MSGAAMGTRYSHLCLEERCRLRGMMEMRLSISEIARRMGRHRSTIQRELERNRCADGYRPDSAGRRARIREAGLFSKRIGSKCVDSQSKCDTGYVRGRHGTEIQPPQP